MPRIIVTALLISLFGLGTVGTADAYYGCPRLQLPHSDWNHKKFCRPIKATIPGMRCCFGRNLCSPECACCTP
jgi:hypothetical protein